MKLLAPRKRRDKVRIRSEQGHLLSVRQEFQEIYDYFSKAFSRHAEYQLPDEPEPLSEDEIRAAIRSLYKGKAVPDSSQAADVWLLEIDAMTNLCTRVFNDSTALPQGGRALSAVIVAEA